MSGSKSYLRVSSCGYFTVNEFIKNVLKILETITRYKQTNTVNYASTMNRIKSY